MVGSASARRAVCALLATAGLGSEASGRMARTAAGAELGHRRAMIARPLIAQLRTNELGSRNSARNVRLAPGVVSGIIER